VRNEVFRVEVGGQRCIARRGICTTTSLIWEVDLLARLADHGVAVPALVPSADGRLFVDDTIVMEEVDEPLAGARRVVRSRVLPGFLRRRARLLRRWFRVRADRPSGPGPSLSRRRGKAKWPGRPDTG